MAVDSITLNPKVRLRDPYLGVPGLSQLVLVGSAKKDRKHYSLAPLHWSPLSWQQRLRYAGAAAGGSRALSQSLAAR